MGSKRVPLGEDVFRRLRAEKRTGESFSEIIARLPEANQPSLMRRVIRT